MDNSDTNNMKPFVYKADIKKRYDFGVSTLNWNDIKNNFNESLNILKKLPIAENFNKDKRSASVMKTFLISGLLVFISFVSAWAGDNTPTVLSNKEAIALVQTNADYVWTLVAAALVFFMQAGFAMVEAGFTRAKNAINIMMKNLMDFSMGSLAFWAVGFGLMFGVSKTGWFGTSGFFLSDFSPGGDPWVLAFWMFQVVFAATAATIVSGAMAERTRFSGYLIYSIFVSALIYPIFGSWAWGSLYKGSGWLESLGFIDFAGSTVVHSVGGWAALAGCVVLGPRLGKYTKDGKVKPILGHNITLAALGVFILWLGWFGFNPGSTTAANKDIAMIFVNTNLAAAAGAVLAMFTSWIKFGKPEVGMSLNGALAGLVAITSPCATVTPLSAVMIGAIAGVIVTLVADLGPLPIATTATVILLICLLAAGFSGLAGYGVYQLIQNMEAEALVEEARASVPATEPNAAGTNS
mgnify:CR=1 FL=1